MAEIDSAAHRSRFLIKLNYDSPAVEIFVTDYEEDVTYGGDVYTSIPALGLVLPANTADLRDTPLKMTLPAGTSAFFDRVSNGEPFAPVEIQVIEQILNVETTAEDIFVLYRGMLSRSIKNYNNDEGLIRLEFLSIKSRLDVPLGLPANTQCPWQLGDHNCQLSPALVSEVGTVATITGKVVQITGLSAHPGIENDRYWEKGFVERDGLRILIRRYLQPASVQFHLVARPPADWLTQLVTVTPGCDKTIETCRARWNNEEHFGGFGYAIPNYQPLYETPSL